MVSYCVFVLQKLSCSDNIFVSIQYINPYWGFRVYQHCSRKPRLKSYFLTDCLIQSGFTEPYIYCSLLNSCVERCEGTSFRLRYQPLFMFWCCVNCPNAFCKRHTRWPREERVVWIRAHSEANFVTELKHCFFGLCTFCLFQQLSLFLLSKSYWVTWF